MSTPFLAKWDGEAFQPLARFLGRCQAGYKVGQTYALAEPQEHSDISRGHFDLAGVAS